MNYIYCECGGRTAQGTSLVKFCSSCGEPFVKTAAVAANPKPPIPAPSIVSKKKNPRYEPDEDEDDEDDLTDAEDDTDGDEEEARQRVRQNVDLSNNPLQVEVFSPKIIDINQLAGTRKDVVPVNKINVREQSKSKISKKEFEKQWRDEAGTFRKK